MSRTLRSLVFCLAASGGLMAADVDAPPPITFGTKEWLNRLWSDSRPRVEISQPAKLNDFASSGKLELSLRQYLELVLANNTQIQIQKLLVQPTRNAITRAFAIFDPVANARFQATRSNTPATNVLQGAANVSNLTQPFSLGVNQTLPTGTQYTVGFNSQKFSTNDTFQLYNPSFNTGLTMGFTQPLLRGRGGYVTKIPILLAKSNLKISEAQTEDQVQRLLVAAENAYWDVIFARENLKVQEQALALSDAALKRAQRELELGALSALEIFQPQAQYARSEILVTQSRYRLAQAEDALRLQAGIDLDPEIRKLPIVLTEPVLPPSDTKPFDREALVSEAVSLRPDLRAIRENVANDKLSLDQAVNNLRPQLNLTGSFAGTGRGGTFYPRAGTILPGGGVVPPTGGVVIPGGISDALSQMFAFDFPTMGFGVTLNFPLRDRRAAADYADALVQNRINKYNERQTIQTARLEVLNAINQVENSRASVDLAKIAADLAQKRFEADQKRYELGTITLFFLLDAQTALNTAQSDLVNQSVQYRRNLLNLLQRSGKLLQERGVTLD